MCVTLPHITDQWGCGCVIIFERLQYLRGTENLYCDIALNSEEFQQMMGFIRRYYTAYLDKWLTMDVDAIAFNDDWGSQRSMLINPEAWRKLFKPVYQELIGQSEVRPDVPLENAETVFKVWNEEFFF